MPSSDALYDNQFPLAPSDAPELPPEAIEAGEGKFWGIDEQPEEEPAPQKGFVPQVPEVNVWDSYDPEWTDEINGLMYLGRSRMVKIGPHSIVIRMPAAEASMQAMLFVKAYDNSPAALRAVTIATLAVCIESVNGNALPEGLLADGSDTLETRFNWVSKWSNPVIDKIYDEYLILEGQIREAIDSLGKEAAPPTAPSTLG